MARQDKKPQDKKPVVTRYATSNEPTKEQINDELSRLYHQQLRIELTTKTEQDRRKNFAQLKEVNKEIFKLLDSADNQPLDDARIERLAEGKTQDTIRRTRKVTRHLETAKLSGYDRANVSDDIYLDLHKDYVTPDLVKEINKGRYSAEPEHAVNPKDMLDTEMLRKPESRPSYKVTIPGGMEVGMYGSIFNSLLSDYIDSKQDNQPKPSGQPNVPQDKQPTSKPSKGGESKQGGQPNQEQQGGGNDFNSTISETSALVDLAGKMGDLLMKDPNVQQQMQGGQSQFGQPQAPGITPFGRDVDRAISEVFPQQGPNPTSIMYDELQKLIAAPMQSPGDIVSKNAALASKYALEGNVKLANRHAQTADYLADALQKVEPYHTANLRMQSDREERRAGLQKEVMRTGAGIQERKIAGEADIKSRRYATDVAMEESRRKSAEDRQPEILARGSESATLAADISSSLSQSDPETTELISSFLGGKQGEVPPETLIDYYAADAVFNKGFGPGTVDQGPLNMALSKATERITSLNAQLANLRQYGTANAATLTDFNSRIDEADTIRSKLADLKEAVKTKVKSYSEQKAYLEEVQRQAIGRDPWSQTRYTEKGVEYTERPSFVENRNKAQQEMQSAEYLKILQQQTEVKNRKKPK